jgi:hypothetical protein
MAMNPARFRALLDWRLNWSKEDRRKDQISTVDARAARSIVEIRLRLPYLGTALREDDVPVEVDSLDELLLVS